MNHPWLSYHAHAILDDGGSIGSFVETCHTGIIALGDLGKVATSDSVNRCHLETIISLVQRVSTPLSDKNRLCLTAAERVTGTSRTRPVPCWLNQIHALLIRLQAVLLSIPFS